MKEKRALIDTFTGRIYLVGPGGYEIKLSPGSKRLPLQRSEQGHQMLPCTRYSTSSSHQSKDEVLTFVVGEYFQEQEGRQGTARESAVSQDESCE